MKVLVIGATGGTGKHAVALLADRGDEVTALARDPSKIVPRPRLTVVKGDARDAASLKAAAQGQDAVLSAFGPRSLKKDDLQEVLMKNLIAAMNAAGVKKLVNLSAWGASESRSQANLLFRIARATILRHVYADKERGEVLLFASDLDYVNVRPGRLTDGPAQGGVKAALEGKGLKPVMTRADLAAFMVAQLGSPEWSRRSPLIGY